ncbi:MAG TPA: ABC transporter substrate-binding protein [Bacteriovoracaceae bacterium]|nr:ABC transporter substrate-binding protein [Bacteriovoracaceae bacterium]
MKIIRLLPLLVLLLSFEAFSKKIVHIGLASNFSELSTVSFNPFGGYFKDAIELAIKDNKSLLEKANIEFRLTELDYGTNDLNIIKQIKEAAKTDMVAVIGYNYSSSALIAASIHVQEKLPMFSPSASANRLRTFGKYVHLGSFDNAFMTKTLAKIATQVLKRKRVLILTAVNCAYCVDLSSTFTKEIEKRGGVIVKNISIIQEDSDFTKIALEAKKLSFDVVFVPNQEITAARLISALVEVGINTPFLGADSWGNEGTEFFRVLKGKKFNGYSVTHWHPKLKTKKSQKFVADYIKNYQKLPNDTSVLAYDSMTMFIQTISKIKDFNRENVEKALNAVNTFNGVTGTYYFTPNKAPRKDILVLKTTDSGFAIHQIISPDKGGNL